MMMRALAGIPLFVLFCGLAFGQTGDATPVASAAPAINAASTPNAVSTPPVFDIADVHASAHTAQSFVRGGNLRGDRYDLRDATMVDLVSAAYGIEAGNVLGGPSWLERDRFDVIAKAPPTTSKETIKLMLQALLADRFKLVVHNDSKPLPAYVLSVGKGGKPKLKESDDSAPATCGEGPKQPDPPPGGVPYISVTCHNMTMEKFAQSLHEMAGGYLQSPVVDQTGLKGYWDIDIKWTGRGALAKAGADGISIFDAVDKQLGLKLEMQKASLPVVIVESVNEKPTPNSAGVVTKLPTPPPAEFEVAVIKPSKPGETNLRGRINGGQVDVTNAPLKFLIAFAWDLNENSDEMIGDAPKC
jgi:uncharacterized protein (TIGR03435 family)